MFRNALHHHILDGIPHIFNHSGNLSVPMWGWASARRGTGAMLAEYIQNFVHIPSLFASGIEFARLSRLLLLLLRNCSCFQGKVLVLTADTGDIYFSIAYILTSFHYDRPETLQLLIARQQSLPGSFYYNDLWFPIYLIIYSTGELLILWHFINI